MSSSGPAPCCSSEPLLSPGSALRLAASRPPRQPPMSLGSCSPSRPPKLPLSSINLSPIPSAACPSSPPRTSGPLDAPPLAGATAWKDVFSDPFKFSCNGYSAHRGGCTHSVDELFDLLCCSNELCLPFANEKGLVCSLPDCGAMHHFSPYPPGVDLCSSPGCGYYSTCASSTSPHQGSSILDGPPHPQSIPSTCAPSTLGCECCEAGCPPSPISTEPCFGCGPSSGPLTRRRRNSGLISASSSSTPSFSDTDPNPPNLAGSLEPLNEDIVWIDKELEELIKCCCCDEPTPGFILPAHHATAHPTHHVNFNLFENPSSVSFPPTPHQFPDNNSSSPAPLAQRGAVQPGFTVKCQWQDCKQEFASKDELVSHVNICHLLRSPALMPSVSQVVPSSTLAPVSPSPVCAGRRLPSAIAERTFQDQMDCVLSDSGPSSQGWSPKDLTAVPTGSIHTIRPSLQFGHNSQSCSADSDCTGASLLSQINSAPARGRPSIDEYYARDASGVLDRAACIMRSCKDPVHRFLCTQSQPPISMAKTSYQNEGPTPAVLSSLDSSLKFESCLDPVLCDTRSPAVVEPADQTPAPSVVQHICRWGSCTGKVFATTAQLTEHLSNDHVGSGKSHYSCLWADCCAAPNKAAKEDGSESSAEDRSEAPRKSFNQRQKVMRHLQVHTGDRPFECDLCDKRFGEAATLVQHRRTHTNEKPYGCRHPGCGKSFALQSALTIHTRTHTGDKPFQCPVPDCQASFSESSNLSKHMRTHTGARPFKCSLCGKGFARSDQLIRHKKIHIKLTAAKRPAAAMSGLQKTVKSADANATE